MAANTTSTCTVDPALLSELPGLLSLINAPPAPAVAVPVRIPHGSSHNGHNLPPSWALPTPPSTPAVVATTNIRDIPVPVYDLAMGHGLGKLHQPVPAIVSTPDNDSVSSEPQFLGANLLGPSCLSLNL
ncbi:hypothetical protein BY996DRAFT_6409476 [Phakopsora pachyrhizi]|nr:hypothetical protein BY996DRAFT_6409476 [Phakopsora pachyrhizi]